MHHDKILILDFGSQVTQLIARRIREAHVYCEIHPNDVSDDFVRAFAPKGIVLSGSHASTYEEQDLRAPQAVWDLGVPVLGICYGMFTMAVQQGGKVEASAKREFGYAQVRARGHTKLLDGIEDHRTAEGHGMLDVWMSHGDKVTELPPGFKLMASTPSCPIAGMADEARGYYGVQFHPEVTHTRKGRELLERFVLGIAKAQARLGDARPHRRSRAGDSRAGRRRRGDPGPVGRGRLERGRRADPSRDRRPADLRLRRPRPAAAGRRQGGDGDVCGQAAGEGRACRRERAVLGPPCRRDRPRSQTQDHRPRVRRGVPARSEEAGQSQVAGARHDLPRRDRVRRREDEEGHHDQEPPQRRWPASHAGPEAARALARPLQRRGS